MMNSEGKAGVLVVVVNYRTAGLVIDCLKSLEGEVERLPDLRVQVVDNASGDGSADRIAGAIRREGWGAWASTLPLEVNGGFAAGNNAAIRPALEGPDPPRHVVLLNPDTVVRPGAIATLAAFLDDHPEVGIAGARLVFADGSPQKSTFRFHTVLGEFEDGIRIGPVSKLLEPWIVARPVPTEACRVDWVSGACMIVRREVFDAIGLMDEGYFLYYEEADFCWRAHRAGWPSWFVPEACVVHLVAQSTGVNREAGKRRSEYWFRSRRKYMATHLGPVRSTLANLAWAGGFALYRVSLVLRGRRYGAPERFLSDFVRVHFSGPRGDRQPGRKVAP